MFVTRLSRLMGGGLETVRTTRANRNADKTRHPERFIQALETRLINPFSAAVRYQSRYNYKSFVPETGVWL